MAGSFMDFFRQLLNSIRVSLQSVPITLWLLFICILVIVLILLYIVYISNEKSDVNRQNEPKLNNDPNALQNETERMPFHGGWLSEFLSRKGYFRVGDLSLSFLRALSFLKETVRTYNYKYQLPWFLVLGTEGSGKSSLFENAGLHLPLGKPDFSKGKANPDCKWWFLSNGVFIEPRGDLFIQKHALKSKEKLWRSLILLLTRYRSARPINGIILTIPATELYGRNKESLDLIHQRAELISAKLTAAQISIGLRIPVYVVVTKTDRVPGFQSFARHIPLKNRQDMFGWSNPYSLSSAFSSVWINEAFEAISNKLHQHRLDIFAHSGALLNAHLEINDGVFVFPSEITKLKESLSLYVNSLFKPSSYQDGFVFRGLYFTGDAGADALSAIPLKADAFDYGYGDGGDPYDITVIPLPFDPETIRLESTKETVEEAAPVTEDTYAPPLMDEKRELKLIYVNDLFTKKIAYEAGLAKPLRQRLMSLNRNILAAKIITGLFVVIGSYGLFNAYDTFAKSRNNITPVLANMNLVLHEIKIEKKKSQYLTYRSADQFNLYTHQIVDMMMQLQKTDLFSIFVPASWFSHLNHDLHKSLKIAFQEIIIRSVANGLAVRAQELLYLRPTPDDFSRNITDVLLPLRSPEFLILQRYVNGLSDLSNHVAMFNSLRITGDPEHLKALIAYTFKCELPDDFWNQYKVFRNVLRETKLNPLHLETFQQVARETLDILYKNFTNAVFSNQIPNSLPSRLKEFLASLSQQTTHRLPDLKYLREISLELARTRPLIGEAGKSWLDQQYFRPGKELEILFDQIDASRLFGKEVTQYLVDKAAIGFSDLKLQLLALNAIVLSPKTTGPVAPLVAVKADENNYPSKGILEIERCLSALLSESYMAAPTHFSFTTTTPRGKIIYWDPALIDIAYDMSKAFEDFSGKKISTFPIVLQENLKLLARQSLQQNIISLLSQAQNFVDLPESYSVNAAEEVLRAKISDFNASAPKFTKLLSILNKDTVGIAFADLRTLLVGNSFWLLDNVKKMLTTLNPYAVKDFSFSWWNGKLGAAFTGFAVRDLPDLESYMNIQNQLIQKLALDFAKPIVMFLKSPVFAESAEKQPILRKWARIVEQMEAFANRIPGNSVQQLHEFVTKDLALMDAKEILNQVSIVELRGESGDFFAETLLALKKGARSRAEILLRQKAVDAYRKLALYFNQNLKGKFPFVTSNLSLVTEEADPESIREFFRLHNEAGGNAETILNQLHQLGNVMKNGTQFFQTLDKLKQFFGTFLDPSSGMPVPAFDFSVDFRVNRTKESGADMVVDWVFNPNDITKINKNDKLKTGRWVFGNEVKFSFRWPDGEKIPAKPERDPAQPNLSIEGRTAVFTFKGNWGLLWAMRMQDAASEYGNTPNKPNPTLMKFSIPNGQNSKAVLFNSISLTVPSLSAHAKGQVMRLPDFPAIAPELPGAGELYAERAVLTEGVVQEVSNLKSATTDGASNVSPSISASGAQKQIGVQPTGTQSMANPLATQAAGLQGAKPR